MKILLYGINYWPELTGIGKYSGEMCEFFSKKGHDVRVITTPPYYPEWEVKNNYSAWKYNKENHQAVTIYRVPLYVPKKPTTLTRIIHLVSYFFTSLPIAFKQIFWKPDVVIFVQPTLFAFVGAFLLSKLSGAKSIMHIQDFEVDAMLGLGMIKQGFFINRLKQSERLLMKSFDRISTISYRMMDNALNKGVAEDKMIFFPNWADVNFVSSDVCGEALKKEWGFALQDKIVLYAGNIGKKQGLELILDAAEIIDDKSVCFLIVGTGAHVKQLKAQAQSRNLTHVFFKPLQAWERVPEMLAMADIHLVIQKKGAADAVLPSKLTNILSAGGHALVTAEKDTELGLLAQRFPGIFKCIQPEEPKLFINALEELLEKDLGQPNLIARNYALEYLASDKILQRFEDDINALLVEKSSATNLW